MANEKILGIEHSQFLINKSTKFTYVVLVLYALFGCALVWSWSSIEPVRNAWNHLDSRTFEILNGSMHPNTIWHLWWTLCNSRWFDLVPAILILLPFAMYLLEHRRKFMAQRIKLGFALAIFVGLWQRLVVKTFLEQERASPSLVVPDHVEIEAIYSWIPAVKSTADFSFPGDHAGVLWLIALVIFHLCGKARGLFAMSVASLFCLPRLFGGAHWLSDVVVGGGASALLGASVFLHFVQLWQTRFVPQILSRSNASN